MSRSENDLVVGAQGTVTLAQDQIKKLISNSNDPSMFLISLKAHGIAAPAASG